MLGNTYFLGNMYSLPLLIKTLLLIRGQSSMITISLNLNYFPRGPISKYHHIGDSDFNIWMGGNTNIQSTALYKCELLQLSPSTMPTHCHQCEILRPVGCLQTVQILHLDLTMDHGYREAKPPCLFQAQKVNQTCTSGMENSASWLVYGNCLS